MSPITTHILDVASGVPGAGISVVLERKTDASEWHQLGQGTSDTDGRVGDLLPSEEPFLTGQYRLVFDTGDYFALRNAVGFFPQVTISFIVKDTLQHYHVPLLLSPFGYTTYRGS